MAWEGGPVEAEWERHLQGGEIDYSTTKMKSAHLFVTCDRSPASILFSSILKELQSITESICPLYDSES